MRDRAGSKGRHIYSRVYSCVLKYENKCRGSLTIPSLSIIYLNSASIHPS